MPKQARILCIEDEPYLREDLVDELRDHGYHVLEASDGLTGLATILENQLDLVLCDVQLPGLGGSDVLQRVREHAAGQSHVPFIFLTAYGERTCEQLREKAGVTHCLVKPVDYGALLALIERILVDETRRA